MYWEVESTLVPTRAMHPARGEAPYPIAVTSAAGKRAARI